MTGAVEVEVDPDRHRYGAAGAPLTVVEYGDFECPYCREAAPVLRELVDGSDGAVALVWRHFPLFTVHPFALTAALAAEAAGDRFWALHEQLFAHQDRLTDPDLARYAAEAGVPGEVVGAAAQAFRSAVEADYRGGVAAGVRGTPTLFLGGRSGDGVRGGRLERYEGRVRAADLRAALGLLR